MTVSALERKTRAESFYVDALRCLKRARLPFLIGGAYAMREYAGIFRDTKDIDVFCKPGDYPQVLEIFRSQGYETEITDADWLAKAFDRDEFIDIIFNSANGRCRVDDTWFDRAPEADVLGVRVRLVPAEEVVWTKAYVSDRYRYDGADVNHIFRMYGDRLDWRHLLMRMDLDWELLLSHILTFRFVYPSEREKVQRWLLEELLARLQRQLDEPVPHDRICRGTLLSRTQYDIDVGDWGYTDK